MRVGILLPGFSSSESDWAIPVQLNLVREMAKSDEVRVLTLRYPHRRNRYSVHGAEVYSLGVGQVRGLRRFALWLNALLTLRRLHHQQPFDILHAMWADETGLIAAWAGRWLGIPVVVSIAGGELVGLQDIGYGLQRSSFSRWIVGQALNGANCVIPACSYAQRLITQAGYNHSPNKTRIITLGVDTSVFHPSENHPSNNKKLIHAASLAPVKDQATLLRALAHLDTSVTLDIIGKGSEETNLRSLAAELGISQRVRFVGAVPHLETPAYYQQAALNILCSRHEGLGMVTLEAAACGVPTVGTSVGLLPDHPALGIHVPIGDDRALAAAIYLLLENEGQRVALGSAARQLVEEHFTIQGTVRQFHMLYEELAANKYP